MPTKRKNMIGVTKNRLTIIADAPDSKGFRQVRCKCSCGNEKTARLTSIMYGTTQSCGCATKGRVPVNKTHGMSKDRFYFLWNGLQARCYDPKSEKYKVYGKRGIKCLWRSFDEFKQDMYQSYLEHKKTSTNGTTLERIDVDGPYSKGNCRWATYKEQANNKRNNCLFTLNGVTKNISQWAASVGMKPMALRQRLVAAGWPLEKALYQPFRGRD